MNGAWKVAICGGGTGGHVYPALAVVSALDEMGLSSDDMIWIGTHGEMETELVPRAGLALKTVAGGPIVGVGRGEQVRNGMKLLSSVPKARGMLNEFGADVLFLTGGYVNAPVALAARMLSIPSVVYLPDVQPGTAIQRIERFVESVACTTRDSAAYLPASAAGKLVETGYPVRQSFKEAVSMPKTDALAAFDLTDDLPVLFVFGGSRGAQSINRALMMVLPQLLTRYQVIHVSGTHTWKEVSLNADILTSGLSNNYRPYAYLHEEMALAFRAADLVVARAGASMLGECPLFGLPSILIPYPYAWDVQKINADYLVSKGAAVRLNDEDMGDTLLGTIDGLMQDEGRLEKMGECAKELARPRAAHAIAQLLEKTVRRS